MFRHDRTASFLGEENFLFQFLPNANSERNLYSWMKSLMCIPCLSDDRINDLENIRISIQKPTAKPKICSKPYKKFQTFTEKERLPVRTFFILQHKNYTFLAIHYPVSPSFSPPYLPPPPTPPPHSLSPHPTPPPPFISPLPPIPFPSSLYPTLPLFPPSPPPPPPPPPPSYASPSSLSSPPPPSPPPTPPPPPTLPSTSNLPALRPSNASSTQILIEELVIKIAAKFSFIFFYDFSTKEPKILQKLSEKSFIIRLSLKQYISDKFASLHQLSSPLSSFVSRVHSSSSPSLICPPSSSPPYIPSTLPPPSFLLPSPFLPPPSIPPPSSLPPSPLHSPFSIPPSSTPSIPPPPSLPISSPPPPSLCFRPPPSSAPAPAPLPSTSNLACYDTILVDRRFLKANGPRTLASLAILDFWGLELNKIGGPTKAKKFFQKMIGNALKKSSNLLAMFREDIDVTWMAEIFEKVVNSLSLEPPSLSLSLYLPSSPSPSPFFVVYSPHNLSHAKRETDFLLSHLPKGPQLLSELGSAYLKRVLWNSWSVGMKEEGFLEGVGRRVLEGWGHHEEVRKWGNQMGIDSMDSISLSRSTSIIQVQMTPIQSPKKKELLSPSTNPTNIVPSSFDENPKSSYSAPISSYQRRSILSEISVYNTREDEY